MPKYKIAFFFDAHSGICLWSANDAARDRFDYPIYPCELPLSPVTIEKVDFVISWYDTIFDLDSRANSGPRPQVEYDQFNAAAAELFKTIAAELGDEFEVVNRHRDI